MLIDKCCICGSMIPIGTGCICDQCLGVDVFQSLATYEVVEVTEVDTISGLIDVRDTITWVP